MFLNKLKTKQYQIFWIIFSVVFLFFCSSKFVFGLALGDQTEWKSTPLETMQTFDYATNITLISWDYNPRTSYSEAIFSIDDSENDYTKVYRATSFLSTSPSRELVDTTVVQLDQTLVVQMYFESSFEVAKIEISNENDVAKTFYTSANSVVFDDTLTQKSEAEYLENGLRLRIKSIQLEITEKENEILLVAEQEGKMEQEIIKLESQKEFQTSEEQAKTDATIRKKESNLETLDKTKTTIQDEILALEKKIFRIQEQINSLKNE